MTFFYESKQAIEKCSIQEFFSFLQAFIISGRFLPIVSVKRNALEETECYGISNVTEFRPFSKNHNLNEKKIKISQNQPHIHPQHKILHLMKYVLRKSGENKFSTFLKREIFEENQSEYFQKLNTSFCSEFDADFKYM